MEELQRAGISAASKRADLKQLPTALRYTSSDLAQAGLKQPLTDCSDEEMRKWKKKDSTKNTLMELWERQDGVRARLEREG